MDDLLIKLGIDRLSIAERLWLIRAISESIENDLTGGRDRPTAEEIAAVRLRAMRKRMDKGSAG